jgi:hypothetical protein
VGQAVSPAKLALDHGHCPGVATSPPQQQIGSAGCGSVDPAGDDAQGLGGSKQNVNVVGHHYPGTEVIVVSFSLSRSQSLRHQHREARIPEPRRAASGPAELAIKLHKLRSSRPGRSQDGLEHRHRPSQTPSQKEKSALRLPAG